MTHVRSPSRDGDVHSLHWRKSSYSGANGQTSCIEVAACSGTRLVRDSKAPSADALGFPAHSWARFTNGLPNETP